MNILFVCTANKLRSPTAESVFSGTPGIEVRSAGLDAGCPHPLTKEMVQWADRIFVMEQRHKKIVKRRFRAALHTTPLISLGIPDEYEFMQSELIAILHQRMPPFIEEEQL